MASTAAQSGGANSAIRRIQRELKEISEEPSKHWTAAPALDDLFEWSFAVRGPPGTEFEGGIYTGRIVLPVNYPLAPPSITLLTPSGRWEVGKKICLSNSNYHPELWQPAWGIRTMMEALRSHFPFPGDGAIGALDWPADLRRRLAKESLDFVCPPSTRKNRELLPELSPEELADDGEPPAPADQTVATPVSAAAPTAAPPVSETAAPPVSAPAYAPTPTPSPVQVVDEGLRQRRGGGDGGAEVSPAPALLSEPPAEAELSNPRRRREEGAVRVPRRQASIFMQLFKPPQTKREVILWVIHVLMLLLVVSFFVILADMIANPPKLLDSQRDSKGDLAG